MYVSPKKIELQREQKGGATKVCFVEGLPKTPRLVWTPVSKIVHFCFDTFSFEEQSSFQYKVSYAVHDTHQMGYSKPIERIPSKREPLRFSHCQTVHDDVHYPRTHLSTPAAAMSSTHWAGCVTIRCASSNAFVCFRKPLMTFDY